MTFEVKENFFQNVIHSDIFFHSAVSVGGGGGVLVLTFRGRVQAPATPCKNDNDDNDDDTSDDIILTSTPSECCWTGDNGFRLLSLLDLCPVH